MRSLGISALLHTDPAATHQQRLQRCFCKKCDSCQYPNINLSSTVTCGGILCSNDMFHMFKRLLEERWTVYAVLSDGNITKFADAKTLDLKDEHWQTVEILIPILRSWSVPQIQCAVRRMFAFRWYIRSHIASSLNT